MSWATGWGTEFFPWRNRTNEDVISRLEITEDEEWASLTLLVINRSDLRVWAEEVIVALADLDANMQTSIPAGQATHIIRQPIEPGETLALSLSREVYAAAGSPQGVYGCIVSATTRLLCDDRWFERADQQRRLEMRALIPISLRLLKRNEQSDFGGSGVVSHELTSKQR